MAKVAKTKQKSTQQKSYDRNSKDNKFNIGSNVSGQIDIIDTTKEQPTKYKIPTVWFTPNAMRISQYIVSNSKKEVAWMALTKRLEGGDILITDDIFIPKQIVSSTEVTITEDAMMDLAMEIMETHDDTSALLAHFHSHVNMQVYPSSQDNAQIEEYFDSMPPYFVRGIFNKKGDIRVDVFFPKAMIGFNTVPTDILYDVEEPNFKKLDKVMTANISEEKWTQTNYGNWHQIGKTGATDPLISDKQLKTAVDNYYDYDDNGDSYWGKGGCDSPGSGADNGTYFPEEGEGEEEESEKKSRDFTGYGTGWDTDSPLEERPRDWENDPCYLYEAEHDPVFFDYYNTEADYGL